MILLFMILGFGDGFFHIRGLLYWDNTNDRYYPLRLGALYTVVGIVFAFLLYLYSIFSHVVVLVGIWVVTGAGISAMYYRRLYRWVKRHVDFLEDKSRHVVYNGTIGALLSLLCVSPLYVGLFLENRILLLLSPLVAIPWTWIFRNISQSKPSTLESRSDPPEDGKNVVFIMADDVRRDRMSLYGYERDTTPFLEKLVTNRNPYVFQNCVSAGTRSGHSIPTLLSGVFASVHGYGANFDKIRILPDEFRDSGYVTAGLSANGHISTPNLGDRFDWFAQFTAGTSYRFEIQRLLAKVINRLGFDYIPVYIKNPSAAFLTGLSKEFVRERVENGEKFFLFVTYMDVHDPYIRRFEDVSDFAADHGETLSKGEWMTQTSGKMTQWYNDEYKDWGYDESIRYVDSQIADFYGFLDDEGILDDTIVVITSDHGELLGERDYWGHIDIPYNPLFEVPLIVDDDSGTTVEQTVSGAQLPSLLLDLANVQPSDEMLDQWLTTLSVEDLVATAEDSSALVDFYAPEINTKGYEHPLTGTVHEKDYSLAKQRLLVSDRWKLLQLPDEYYFFDYDDVFFDEPLEETTIPEDDRLRLTERMQSLDEVLESNQYTGEGYYEGLEDEKIKRQLRDLGYI